jgi:hypothetical protein
MGLIVGGWQKRDNEAKSAIIDWADRLLADL